MAPGIFQAAHETALTSEQHAFAAALRERCAVHARAISAGDVETLVSFFTEDAVWIGSGWPTRVGHAQLRELFSEVAGSATVEWRSLHSYVDGSTGWDFGDYTVSPRDPNTPGWTFRTAFQWVRRESGWLCNGVLCFAAP